ncbi:MAG: DegV family protein [Bacillota bacterium]|nr:DegV family protein [Candidatus Fermentithermobacillaceae bacterium]
MPSVKIVTDSACDIDPHNLEELGVRVVPLTVRFGEESYLDNYELRGKAFYDKLRTSEVLPRTSSPSVGDFCKAFDELTADGSGVVAILLSEVLSGTYQAAQMAASMLPGRKIAVINSKTASVGYGLIVLEARDLAEQGAGFEEVRDAAQSMVDRLVTMYAVDTLDYLYKNGRIGRAKHLWGSMLNLKCILVLDDEGYVSGIDRVRGKSRVIPRLIELAGERVPFGSKIKLGMCHADVAGQGAELVAAAKDKWHVIRTVETEIGAVIGAHNGPGTLALILLPVE